MDAEKWRTLNKGKAKGNVEGLRPKKRICLMARGLQSGQINYILPGKDMPIS